MTHPILERLKLIPGVIDASTLREDARTGVTVFRITTSELVSDASENDAIEMIMSVSPHSWGAHLRFIRNFRCYWELTIRFPAKQEGMF